MHSYDIIRSSSAPESEPSDSPWYLARGGTPECFFDAGPFSTDAEPGRFFDEEDFRRGAAAAAALPVFLLLALELEGVRKRDGDSTGVFLFFLVTPVLLSGALFFFLL